MTAEPDVTDAMPKKRSKLPLILGFVLALVGGAGGFYAVQSGLIGGTSAKVEEHDGLAGETYQDVPDVAFVALDPLVISLPSTGGRDHLRFAAQLEVVPGKAAEIEAIKPRIIDVLNGYLRAVDLAELEDPTALLRLRAQMLRRVQVVSGPDRIKDLLIMEFVLS